jgi:hypothetical protein
MGLTFEQRIFNVENYFARISCVLCQEVVSDENGLNKMVVHYLIRKFYETGSEYYWKQPMRSSVCFSPSLSH